MIPVRATIAIVLLYVFFRDLRPSEPYLTPYLVEDKNLPKVSVYNQIYPCWSYAQLPIFLMVLSTVDVLKFRPLIWLGALGYVCTWLLLVLGTTVKEMQFMQVTYAVGTACEIAYKSYIYVAVPRYLYSSVTLYLSGAALLAKSLSAFTSEILHDEGGVSLLVLNYVSLGCVSVALLLSLLIPAPRYSKIVSPENHRYNLGLAVLTNTPRLRDRCSLRLSWLLSKMQDVWRRIRLSYRSPTTKRWAYWAITMSSLYYMVGNTSQSLWEELERKGDKRYNGYVIATNHLLSSLVSFLLSRVSDRLEILPGSVMAGSSLLIAVTTILPSTIPNLYLAYVCDGIFNILVSSSVTIATFRIASSLSTDLFGFVIAVNSTVAGTIDLIVTFVVADAAVLGCTPVHQYWVYSGFAVMYGAVYLAYRLGYKCGGGQLEEELQDTSTLLVEDVDDEFWGVDELRRAFGSQENVFGDNFDTEMIKEM